MFLKRDFQDQKAQVLRLKLLVTVLFGTAKNPFILKQDERSIQMDNNNRWHSRELEWNEFCDY